MDFGYIYPVLILFGSFVVMLTIGVPITFTIGLSSLLSIVTALPPDAAVSMISQEMTVGLDGFTLLTTPSFVLTGNTMNTGSIARRLVNLTQALVGRLPDSLAHCNILANTLFGAVSGSTIASAAAAGGIISPLQEKEGHDPTFSATANITSVPIGLMISPSSVLIVYSLASGGISVTVLFLAGYLPGILTAVTLMFVATLYTRRSRYPVAGHINFRRFLQVFCESIPNLMLIFIVINGIIAGVFTPTEAPAVAIIYSLALTMIYREITLRKLNSILLGSVVISSTVLLLVGYSMRMS